MENLKELENMYGPMENSMRVSGLEVKNKDLGCGEAPKVIPILENGKEGRQMDMEFILGSMEIVTKDNLKIALSMGKGSKNLQTAIYIEVHIKKENPQDLENTIGPMGVILKDNFFMG